MANYSTDDDLRPLVQNLSPLQPTEPRHADATLEINRRLRERRMDDDDISHLSTQTLNDLKRPACLYILAEYYLAFDDPAMVEKSDVYRRLYASAMNALVAVLDEDADGVDEGDEIYGGGTMALG